MYFRQVFQYSNEIIFPVYSQIFATKLYIRPTMNNGPRRNIIFKTKFVDINLVPRYINIYG